MFSTSNITALEILKNVESQISPEKQTSAGRIYSPRYVEAGWGRTSPFGPKVAPISDVTNQAAAAIAAIVAILDENNKLDLSAQQYSAAYIAGQDNATVIGGDGNNNVGVHNHATITTGDGNDNIGAFYYAAIDSGAGDDSIGTYGNATIAAGDGNDYIHTYDNSTVDGGAGSDYIYGYNHMTVTGGAGNDEIRVYGYANIDAGEGNDLVVTEGHATVNGGSGNDTLLVSEISSKKIEEMGYSNLDGGEGDDYIQTGASSNVTGGTGNDMIRLTGGNSTVTFNKGDGQDAITSRHDFTLNVSGYSKGDATITAQGEDSIVSFAGSNDSLTLNLSSGATARLTFEDGSTLDIKGTNGRKLLQLVRADSDWGGNQPVDFFYSYN